MSHLNYEELDPGIRELVRFLHAQGWQTTDSGDGVSKPEDMYESGEAMPFAHVVVRMSAEGLVDAGRRLYRDLTQREPGAWIVECSFAPHDETAIALVRQAHPPPETGR